MKNLLFLLCFAFLFCNSTHAQKMNNDKMGKLIAEVGDSIQGNPGAWQFKFKQRFLLVITDEKNNRMRIISPIVEAEKLTEEYLKNCLIANYHTALDVKYAISDDLLWSVFIHPLKELSEEQFKDAIQQVYYAAITFGYTYSSTDLIFGGGESEEKKEEEPEKKKDIRQ
jgi:hypothetical protein